MTGSRVPWIAVAVYTAIACGLAWMVLLPVWLTGAAESPLMGTVLMILLMVMMYTPAVATLIVVFLGKVPQQDRLRALGIWPLRPAKRIVWFMVAAIFAPMLIVALTVLVSTELGLVALDLTGFSGFREMLEAQLTQLAQSDPVTAMNLPPVQLLVMLQLLAIPVGAVFNGLFAFGEELGWRGWLLPALRPLGVWPALLISGAIWGLWHSPAILLGYNFGLTDLRGVALMVAGCIAWGVLLGWTRLRTGSVWPAVLGHGALNASAGLVVLLAAAGDAPNMAVVGPLGMVAWGVIAVIVVLLVLAGQFRCEPGLAATQAPVS